MKLRDTARFLFHEVSVALRERRFDSDLFSVRYAHAQACGVDKVIKAPGHSAQPSGSTVDLVRYAQDAGLTDPPPGNDGPEGAH